jgi:hypothetical protein
MTSCRLWICLAAALTAIAFGRPTTAQEPRPEIKYYVVANTTPPDAFLALRTDPSPKTGSRIEVMPNGTALEVLKTNPSGWWYVRVVASGKEGWALSGQNDKHWIVCCVNASGVAATTVTSPLVNETGTIGPPSPAPIPPQHVSQAASPTPEQMKSNETTLERCAREVGGFSGVVSDPRSAEVWKCMERMQGEQAVQLGERACNEYVCLLRLPYVSEATFSGNGYTVKYRVSSSTSKFGNQTLTTWESILTSDDGKRATVSQTLGPVGSIFFGPMTSRPGSEIRASLFGPIGNGVSSYIVLQLPKETVAPNSDNKSTTVFQPCQTAPSDLIPCELKWKAVEVKFDANSRSGAFRGDGTETTAPQNRRDITQSWLKKFVFGNNGDLYVSSGGTEGFVYKINLEIDFVANPSRAPKDALGERLLSGEICMPKSYKGRASFHERALTLSLAEENNCDWNMSNKSTLQIEFAQDFSSCSVVDFSYDHIGIKPDRSEYGTTKVKLEKSVECRIYSAK